MEWIIAGVACIATLVIGFFLGIGYRKKVAEREISSAEEEAKRIINESIKAAESKKREALVEAREEIHKSRNEYEREVKERRAELSKQERRLQQKEETLDRKTDTLEKKTEALNQKIAQAEAQQEEIKLVKKSQLEMLEKISGYTVDEALNEVDKFLDSGMLRGQSTLYIIHGNGTGALRTAIQKHLRTHKAVKNFRLGRYGEGESGVTVVELK